MGDVLQVVPSEHPVYTEPPPPPPVPSPSSNLIMQVGDVLQVVPTSNVDWPAAQTVTTQPPKPVIATSPAIRFPTAGSLTSSPAINASPLPTTVPVILPLGVKPILPTAITLPPPIISSPAVTIPPPKPPPPGMKSYIIV